jgi:hypothetical protein
VRFHQAVGTGKQGIVLRRRMSARSNQKKENCKAQAQAHGIQKNKKQR